MATISDVLRRHIQESGETMYVVAKGAGLDYGTVYRFAQWPFEQVWGSDPVDLGQVLQARLALTGHVGLGAGVAEGRLQTAEAIDTPAA